MGIEAKDRALGHSNKLRKRRKQHRRLRKNGQWERKKKRRLWCCRSHVEKEGRGKESDQLSNAAEESNLRTQWSSVLVRLEDRLEVMTVDIDALWEVFCLKWHQQYGMLAAGDHRIKVWVCLKTDIT